MFLDLHSRCLIQVTIFKHEVNPTEDCYIELRYSIRCEEHDSLVVLKLAKKHRDKAIANKVVICTLLYENIYFV
jgi:hypothetical protein